MTALHALAPLGHGTCPRWLCVGLPLLKPGSSEPFRIREVHSYTRTLLLLMLIPHFAFHICTRTLVRSYAVGSNSAFRIPYSALSTYPRTALVLVFSSQWSVVP